MSVFQEWGWLDYWDRLLVIEVDRVPLVFRLVVDVSLISRKAPLSGGVA
jgi:hypothetical protein